MSGSDVHFQSNPGWFEPTDTQSVLAFHQKLPGYQPTPLRSVPLVAERLGVQQVWVKDEQNRLGLPAYKILGAAWATVQELQAQFGPFQDWASLSELSSQLSEHLPLTLVAATDGNHGRAVARMARWLGLQAHILVPEDMAAARQEAILSEGATLQQVSGSYDEAVEEAALLAGPQHIVISDTSWDGYTRVPTWVVEGYSTIFAEVSAQLADLQEPEPDVVSVQMGVGSLAAAVVQHCRQQGFQTRVVGTEPLSAACVLRSLQAGTPTEVPGPHPSIMAGLNCGNISPLAWPLLQRGLSVTVGLTDDWTRQAMRLLARDGVVSGESGAAGLAGLLCLKDQHPALWEQVQGQRILLINTEGATDPEGYARVLQDQR